MPQMPGMLRDDSPRRRNGAVAGRGADDLDQRADLDARADRAVVRVEAAHRDGDALRAIQARSPTRRHNCPAGVPGGNARSYRRSRSSASFGSRRARNAFDGSPPHASENIALWPAAQMQRTMSPGIVDAGEHRGHEVGELDPAGRRIEHLRRHLQALPDLRPPPLGRIRAADRLEILRRMLARHRRDRAPLPRRRCGPSITTPARRGGFPIADRSPAAAPARRSAAASSRWCPRRCRSRDRAKSPASRRPARARRTPSAQARRCSPPDSAARGADPSDASARPARRCDSRPRSCRPCGRRRTTRRSRATEFVPKSMPIVKGPGTLTWENGSDAAMRTPDEDAVCDQISTGCGSPLVHAPPTSTGDTTSSTSGPVPAARARSRLGCSARMRTAFSARLAKLIMLRSMARVGSSRYVNWSWL